MTIINSVLIANRGEIAIRISKTLNEMGIKAYGIYSKDDSSSAHLSYCSEVFELNGTGPSAYLNIDEIISLAKSKKIKAVHPGYGFLSENHAFAASCAKNDIIFIGPNEKTLKNFGNKEKAKKLAQKLGIPVCSSSGPIQKKSDILSFFNEIKKNKIILKANFGGGGRGSRIIHKKDDFSEVLSLVKEEAKSFSGSNLIFAEEVIEEARHIEVQILGDGHSCIHLFERDCSFQRNFQKFIEFCPAPNLLSQTKDKLYNYAISLCESVAYKGLGTVEFLVDKNEKIYFMEVNPRVQVEHTITEELTGIDLIRSQISVFNGKSLKDQNIKAGIVLGKRASIQARLNMESYDNKNQLVPTTGTIKEYDIVSGPGIRIDGAGKVGYLNNGLYDSLLAKVIATSEFGLGEAVRKLDFTLRMSNVSGVETNKNLIIEILRQEVPQNGSVNISTIDNNIEVYLQKLNRDTQIGVKENNKNEIPNRPLIDSALTENTIQSELVGTVIDIKVLPNKKIKQGDTVLVQESMKMHHPIKANANGFVSNFFVDIGDTVSTGSPLFEFIPEKESSQKKLKKGKSKKSKKMRGDLENLMERRKLTLDKSRPIAVKKRKKIGKRTARENIKSLIGNNDFFEYGDLVYAAQRSRRSLDDLIKNTPADGLITGLSYVNSDLFAKEQTKTAIMHYDYMVLAGTQGINNHKKLDRMIDVIRGLKVPLIFFCEGGGGRPGDVDAGDQNIAGLNIPSFHDFARLSGEVPLVGIGSGRLFAGNAALLGCCDVIIGTRDLNLGMGGPAMIEGGGLGVYKPEEVGPTSVQYPNGVIDILVDNEDDAIVIAKKYLSYFQGNLGSWEAPEVENLRYVIPENRLEVYDIREVIDNIADIGSVLEIKAGFAKGMFTGFIRVKGKPLGLIANNPLFLAGAIDSDGADKASRFIKLCENYNIPILSLCDTPGMMVGPEIEETGLVRHCCRLFLAGANVTVPMMTIVLRKAYGLGAQAMAGGSFMAPQFVVGWPTAEIGAMGLEGAVKLGYRKELEAESDVEKKEKLFKKLVDDLYEKGKAINAASLLEFDTVLDPIESRDWISMVVESPINSSEKVPKNRYIDSW